MLCLETLENQPAQLLVHVIAYHCSSLHCCLQTGIHPVSGPLCLALHCKNSGGFRPWPPVVVLRDKQWFQTTTLTPLVPEKHQWRSESNSFTVYTSTNIVHFTVNTSEVQLPISRMRMAYTTHRVQLYIRHGAHQTAVSGYSDFPH